MPIYEYHCNACETDFEAWQKITATGSACESCGSEDTTRKVSVTSFVLKGTGWYKTDYASTPKDAKGSKASGDKAESGDKSEKSEKADTSEKADKTEKVDKTEKSSSAPAETSKTSTPSS